MDKILNFVNNNIYFIVGSLVCLLFVALILLVRINRKKTFKYLAIINELDRNKIKATQNAIDHELAKLNKVIKNKELLILLDKWSNQWQDIKDKYVPEITNLIFEAEDKVERRRFKNIDKLISETKLLTEQLNTAADNLYLEICELSKVEEDIREKFTKLRIKFRDAKQLYYDNEPVLIYMKSQLEDKFDVTTNNIYDLDNLIAVNEYAQAESQIISISNEIDVLNVLVEKLPDLIVVVKQYIPRKVIGLEKVYEQYTDSQVYLKHLNFDIKLDEIRKTSDSIIEQMKSLTFTEIEADIDAIVEYTENLEDTLEAEKNNYYIYADNYSELSYLLEDISTYVNNLNEEIDKVKVLYDLQNFDEELYFSSETKLAQLLDESDNLKTTPDGDSYYYDLNQVVVKLVDSAKELLNEVKDNTDSVLRLRADEQRAREQILEIQYLVERSKNMVSEANLPIIPNLYRTNVADAKDGIRYIIDELDKTPINVDILNLRVSTSVELAYKLFNNTKKIIKEAMLAEIVIMYGNRYRSNHNTVESELNKSEKLFFLGDYHDSLNTAVNILEKTEPGIYIQLKKYFENGGFVYE